MCHSDPELAEGEESALRPRSRVFRERADQPSRFLTLRVRNDTSRAGKVLYVIRFLR